MAVDLNEIGAFVRNCPNKLYLMNLRDLIDMRLGDLGVSPSVLTPIPYEEKLRAAGVAPRPETQHGTGK